MRRLLVFGVVCMFLLKAASSYAGTYSVTNTNGDASAGSVRAAFINLDIAGDANNDVVFQTGSAGTITLAADAGTLSYNTHLINNTGSTTTFYRNGNMGGPASGFNIGANISSFEIDSGINIYYIITDASSFSGIEDNDHTFIVNNGLNSNITVQSDGAFVYGIHRLETGADVFTINGGVNGDINISGLNDVFAVWNSGADMTINGGINGNMTVAGTQDVMGLYSVSGDININGGISGNINSTGTGVGVYAINAIAGDVNVAGDISSNINMYTVLDNAMGIHSGQAINLENISGNIYAKADRDNAIAIYADNGALSVSGAISGNLTAIAGRLYAIGLYSDDGKIYGANAATPLNISGNISATAAGYAWAILGYDAMNLNITGDLTAVDTTGSGKAYAIKSGKAAILSQVANDTVTIGGGAQIRGKIDLAEGTDTLILNGSSTIYDDVLNVENLSKIGGGKASLKANVTVNTASIASGALDVDGTLTASTVDITSGAILCGSGTIVGNVNSTGTIAPGNSIGTITINGNLNTSGNIEIEANQTSSDVIVVNGTATVSGGKVTFIFPEAVYIKEKIIHFIQATTFVGNFSVYISNNPMLNITGSGGRANITRISYVDKLAGFALSSSASAAAKSLSDIALNASGSITTILGKLDYMTASDLATFFTQVTAANYDAFTENIYSSADIFSRDKQSRLQYLRSGGKVGPYFTIIRNENDFDRLNDRDEFSITTYGINIGVDKYMGDKVKAGLGVSYLSSDIDFANNMVRNAESDAFIFGGYGTYSLNENWYVDASLQTGTVKNECVRQVSQTGTFYNSNTAYSISEEFSSDYRSAFMGATIESGYLLQLPKDVKAVPFISLEATYLSNDSFTEKSESPLALDVKDSDDSSIRFGLGSVLSKEFSLKNKAVLLPEFKVKWLHSFSDGKRDLKASYKDIENSEFISSTGKKDQDALLIDIGVTLKEAGNYSCKLNYAGKFAGDNNSAEFSFDFNFKF